jgi:glycosyltransferase involved in cell wall biosynthesis
MTRLQILMLTPQLPYPPHQGTSLRNLHILRALAETNEVTLLSFDDADHLSVPAPLRVICQVLPPVTMPTRSMIQRFGQLATTNEPDVALRLRSERFAAALSAALAAKPFDAVQIEGIELAHYISLVKSDAPNTSIVLDCHNAETELQRRALQADVHQVSRWPAALYSAIQVRRLGYYERRVLRAANGVLAVSDIDRERLIKLAPEIDQEVAVVPNTIDVAEYVWDEIVPPEMRFDLVFTGKMDYRPNVDAVLWFAESVWPLIVEQRPQTTWAIVGQRPHRRLDRLRKLKGITITGLVPRVQPYIAGASVYVMPLRMGSGTRLKLIEAMAAGKAIVSTSIGAEGFPVENEKNILLADTASDQSAAILRLLRDAEERSLLGSAARAFAKRYDWRHTVPLLEEFYKSLLTKE